MEYTRILNTLVRLICDDDTLESPPWALNCNAALPRLPRLIEMPLEVALVDIGYQNVTRIYLLPRIEELLWLWDRENSLIYKGKGCSRSAEISRPEARPNYSVFGRRSQGVPVTLVHHAGLVHFGVFVTQYDAKVVNQLVIASRPSLTKP